MVGGVNKGRIIQLSGAISVDWLNPETWKLPADLIDHWRTIVGGAIVVGGGVVSFIKWGWIPISWIWSKIRHRSVKPGQLHFVFNDGQTQWSPSQDGAGKFGTYVHGHWNVTNASDRDIHILKARLAKFEAEHSYVFTRDVAGSGLGSRFPIVPNRMTDLTADFIYPVEICPRGTPLVADVIFTDNYNREHWVRSVRFQYRGPQT
jgi:hypothetical protein